MCHFKGFITQSPTAVNSSQRSFNFFLRNVFNLNHMTAFELIKTQWEFRLKKTEKGNKNV